MGNQAGIYDMTDGVPDEKFEAAITEAKTEGNLSRANVVRKVTGQQPEPRSRAVAAVLGPLRAGRPPMP